MEEPHFVKCEPDWRSDPEDFPELEPHIDLHTDDLLEIKLETNESPTLMKEEHDFQDGRKEKCKRATVTGVEIPSLCGGLQVALDQDCQYVKPIESKNEETFFCATFPCDTCGKEFTRRDSLKAHTLIHLGSKSHVCEICGKAFTQLANLKSHSIVHSGERPFSCSVCYKSFTRRYHLKRHMDLHPNELVPPLDTYAKTFVQRECPENNHIVKTTSPDTTEDYPVSNFGCDVPKSNFADTLPASDNCVEVLISESGNDIPASNSGDVSSGDNALSEIPKRGKFGETFTCVTCGRSFDRLWRLKRHMATHSIVRLHTCPTCGEGFTEFGSLKLHQVVHSGEKPYSCAECKKSFRRFYHLKRHLVIHSEQRGFKCTKCASIFLRPENLQAHLKRNCLRIKSPTTAVVTEQSASNSGIKLTCDIDVLVPNSVKISEASSGVESRASGLSVKRLASDSGVEDKSSKCSINALSLNYVLASANTTKPRLGFAVSDSATGIRPCVKATPVTMGANDIPAVNSRESGHRRFVKRIIKEKERNSRLKRGKTLEQFHRRISLVSRHHGASPHLCETCGKVFTLLSTLRLHQAVHSGERPYSCSKCGERFRRLYHLKRHSIVHSETGEFPCLKCGRTFLRRQYLQIHEIRRCAQTSSSTPSVTRHTKKSNQMEKVALKSEHSCNRCGKVFSSRLFLRQHMSSHSVRQISAAFRYTMEAPPSHSNRKLHFCPVCNETFSHSERLRLHLLLHADPNSVACSSCGKTFDGSDSLEYHMLEHIGESIFSCDVCQKTFKSVGSLKSHAAVHSGERPHSCSVCERTFTRRSHLKRHMIVHCKPFPVV